MLIAELIIAIIKGIKLFYNLYLLLYSAKARIFHLLVILSGG